MTIKELLDLKKKIFNQLDWETLRDLRPADGTKEKKDT